MKFTKKYLIIYSALGIALIPFTILKYLDIKEYSGAINETLEGMILMLGFQLFEAFIVFLIIRLLEMIFKANIQLKYVFPALIVLQILLLIMII